MDDEDFTPVNQQKWRIPKEGMETHILKASRPMVKTPKYTSREEKKAVQDVVKGAISLGSGVVAKYPLEWVEQCIEFCQKLWREGKPMSLENLLKYINNVDKMNDYVAKWANRNHVVMLPLEKK